MEYYGWGIVKKFVTDDVNIIAISFQTKSGGKPIFYRQKNGLFVVYFKIHKEF